MTAKKSLGRGLGALLNDSDDYLENFEERESATAGSGDAGQIELPIEQIIPNDNQPRKHFDEAAMSELVNSIRTHGVITPIIVVKQGEKYMIIAGERRWKASKRAGLRTMPVIVRNYTTQQIKEISLIENIQREDLNPIEIANSIRQLMREHNWTQEEVADRVGKSRSAVANLLGLLSLAGEVIILVAAGRLSPGHAKVLTSIGDKNLQLELALKGADDKLSVRKFEELVKSTKRSNSSKTGVDGPSEYLSLELKDLVQRMQRAFATKVSAIGNDKKGRIYIDYYSRDDLDRFNDIVELVNKYHPVK